MNFMRLAIGGLCVLALTACGSSPRTEAPSRSASLPRVTPRVALVSPADYFANASAIDLYVIKASELALQRSSALRVREVAGRLIAAHKGSSAQLSMSGRRLNLLPSAELQPRHRTLLEQLYASPAFDRDYAAQMRAAHREAALLHSGYAARGDSPTLTQLARALAPVMEQQERLVSYL